MSSSSTVEPLDESQSSLRGRLILLARDVKFSHTVFALPFALLAAFMACASAGRLPPPSLLLLVVVCMVLARTAAMTFNRWADRRFDGLNPRTASRAIPSGRLSGGFVLGSALVCGAAFIMATAGFWFIDANPWPLLFSPLILAWVMGYSVTKRFTWLCHLVLGIALAISTLAAAIAVQPSYLGRGEPYVLAAMVLFWVAGFDVIYALMDVDVDRRDGLQSMPARWGIERALWMSRSMHLLALAALCLLCWLSGVLGVGFSLAIGVVCGLLLLEHLLIWRSPTSRIHMVFFTLNGMISLILGGAGIIDTVSRVR